MVSRDECNIFIPQSPEAEIELRELSSTKCSIMTPQTTSSNLCIIQDGLLGAYLMTKHNYQLPKATFFNICMRGDGWTSSFILKKIQHIRKTLKLLGKKATAFTSRHLFSMMLPDDFNYEKNNEGSDKEPVLKIYRGVLIEGALNKKNLGPKPESLVHLLYKDYNDDVAMKFINNVQFIVNEWLLYHGFSIGMEDCLATKNVEIEEALQTCLFKAEGIKKVIHNKGIQEMKINAILCEARDTGLILAKDALKPNNGFVSTVKAGSKGDFFNISQITGLLGQQNLNGERIPHLIKGLETYDNNTLDSKRTLCYYPDNGVTLEDEYESRGFIKHSFIRGLNPKEFFFHAMTARSGIIDTSLGTAKSGYIQRKIIKLGEDLKVGYDGTVRNALNTICQLNYGDDGFDRSNMIHVDGELQFVDVSRLCDQLNTNYEL